MRSRTGVMTMALGLVCSALGAQQGKAPRCSVSPETAELQKVLNESLEANSEGLFTTLKGADEALGAKSGPWTFTRESAKSTCWLVLSRTDDKGQNTGKLFLSWGLLAGLETGKDGVTLYLKRGP